MSHIFDPDVLRLIPTGVDFSKVIKYLITP